MRYHPILHYWRLHAGIDYAAAAARPVHAAAAGTIICAGWGGGYGNRIVVDHGVHRASTWRRRTTTCSASRRTAGTSRAAS